MNSFGSCRSPKSSWLSHSFKDCPRLHLNENAACRKASNISLPIFLGSGSICLEEFKKHLHTNDKAGGLHGGIMAQSKPTSNKDGTQAQGQLRSEALSSKDHVKTRHSGSVAETKRGFQKPWSLGSRCLRFFFGSADTKDMVPM